MRSLVPIRLNGLDEARGLAVVLMLFGHAFLFFDPKVFVPAGAPHFAPISDRLGLWIEIFQSSVVGFFFYAGLLIGLKAGQPLLRGRLRSRALQLLALDFTIVSWAYAPHFTAWKPTFGALSAFALGFLCLSVLLHLRARTLAGIASLLLLLNEMVVIPHPLEMANLGWLVAVLWVPVNASNYATTFPALSWLPVLLISVGFGKALSQGRLLTLMRPRGLWCLAIGSFVSFVALRQMTPFGSLGQTVPATLLEFFNVSKYPPSIHFLLLNATWCFSYLALGQMNAQRPSFRAFKDTLCAYGTYSLFAYVFHIGLYGFVHHICKLLDLPGSRALAIGMFTITLFATPFAKRRLAALTRCNRVNTAVPLAKNAGASWFC